MTGFGFFGDDETPDEQRKKLQETKSATMKKLYTLDPAAKQYIANSYGYAAFNNIGINLLVVSTANGDGIAHNNKTGKDIYMTMFSAGVGIGAGVKDFRGVFVFANAKVFNHFVEEGWQAGAQTDAAAKSGDKGESHQLAIDVAPGVKLYQMTEAGLALQATIQGTKYMKNDDLN